MKKNPLLIIVIIAAVALAGYFLWRGMRAAPTSEPSPAGETPSATQPEAQSTPSPQTVSEAQKGILYNQALTTYTGLRFQFVDCATGAPVISPGSLSIKQGSKFMLDNRDPETHTIKIGNQSYRMEGESFVIVTAPSRGTYNITCDGGGVAQLFVQS